MSSDFGSSKSSSSVSESQGECEGGERTWVWTQFPEGLFWASPGSQTAPCYAGRQGTGVGSCQWNANNEGFCLCCSTEPDTDGTFIGEERTTPCEYYCPA